jgi:acetyltransferase-like isoleucine patch superfamily enzyme
MAMYTTEELKSLGFANVGANVLISRQASFYGVARISIGDNVRIDDFCVLSAGTGGITLGSHIHIAVYSSIIGAGAVTLDDFCNISSRVSLYSSNDDYSGEYMTNPMVDACYTNVSHAPGVIGKHVIVGSGSVVLPGVTLADGCAVGALSLVSKSLDAWGVYAGQPAKYIKARSCDLLALEEKFLRSYEVKFAKNQ